MEVIDVYTHVRMGNDSVLDYCGTDIPQEIRLLLGKSKIWGRGWNLRGRSVCGVDNLLLLCITRKGSWVPHNPLLLVPE